MKTLTDFTLTDLEKDFLSSGVKAYRAKQVLGWIYKKGCFLFDDMSDLPNELREILKRDYIVTPLVIVKKHRSPVDLTTKYLLKTGDGTAIESVYLTEKDREIVCISSQVGCPLECTFCASGKKGFARNLTAGEMVAEVLLIKDDLNKERINNLVYMGIGEPFLNYDNVMKSIKILMAHWGLGIGSRKITVSTAGYVPGIIRFAGEKSQVRLAVSLHAITDALRDKLMPINKRYPIRELTAALQAYHKISGRKISVEYTLIDGMNDSLDDAKKLYKITRGFTHTINLIPLNRTEEFNFNPPSIGKQLAFQKELIDLGIMTTLRKEKGGDVNAACGQLRLRHLTNG